MGLAGSLARASQAGLQLSISLSDALRIRINQDDERCPSASRPIAVIADLVWVVLADIPAALRFRFLTGFVAAFSFFALLYAAHRLRCAARSAAVPRHSFSACSWPEQTPRIRNFVVNPAAA
jgi:hypothetical protein